MLTRKPRKRKVLSFFLIYFIINKNKIVLGDEWVAKVKPAADKMVDFYTKQGELPLAKTIAAACSDISKQEIFEGFARQFKDKQAAKEEIDRLRNIISQNSASNNANASSSASMTEKKSSKTEKKPIRDQTLEEFLSYVVESTNTDANEKKTNIESTNGKKTDDFANQKTVSFFSFLFLFNK